MSDWRNETAADVSYNWEREEARDAERYAGPHNCPPGKHHMAPDRTGGGTCMYCGETITADEIN